MENISYIALGSNIEDRLYYLKHGVLSLARHSAIKVINGSSIYETEPVGYTDQNRFLNMVIELNTSLSPNELLSVLQQIELDSGRKREMKWGPRTLDLDILLYNQENIETERLKVPHPRMLERAFVMVPLLELNPLLSIPNHAQEIRTLIDKLEDREGVTVWKRKNGEDVFGLFES
ncbi:2-amino-4-hydroxy-6-hydroxymethyldihydropteridine diphosphokinase [Metabacillus iocasae]|uniref:2-amino-4-hydroxy-6-hydroxymethyldihydropteridine diphosphokinase n=1 Tax=Priestia iocasae TaxID=2291674 RepID=A0ABS2R0U8_9BACI|nr:2-amino-4-hydroxy-6-hydroxymethyldihydropteridine diphosphokinase [Metabacillus iocasae]MBM7704887.1 2-amino-4-hydroxy-6-hydroxymethyldihydropteridine diphosphokinase [Metabacillus iocasae]